MQIAPRRRHAGVPERRLNKMDRRPAVEAVRGCARRARAALLLGEHSIPLPALLMQIVHEVDKETGRMTDADVVEQADVKGMAWLLRPLQGRKEP